jgi:hypothetical protein
MQEVEQIEPKEKPSGDQASYYEESSTNVFAEICIPLIEDDDYSILDLFLKFMWKIYGMHLRSHMQTLLHASQESKRELRTSDVILIFSEKKLKKKIRYLNSSQENIQFKKKKTSKMESGQ